MNAKGRHRALCKEKKKNKTMACSFNNHTSRVADGAVSKTKQCEFCSADEITCNASQARYHEDVDVDPLTTPARLSGVATQAESEGRSVDLWVTYSFYKVRGGRWWWWWCW